MIAVVVVALLAALVWAAGSATGRAERVVVDQLGPDRGESAGHYRERARATLSGVADETRWAGVFFQVPVDGATLWRIAGTARIARVWVRGPGVPVQPVSADRRSVETALTNAGVAPTCTCLVAAVLLGDVDALRRAASDPAVKVVEAAPADAGLVVLRSAD